jgi:hypothetical protein
LYGTEAEDVRNPFLKPSETQEELSATSKRVPLPAGMQEEFDAYLAQRPPGALRQEEFASFYEKLADKYDLTVDGFSPQNQKFVEAYNLGKASSAIPFQNEELTGIEKVFAPLAADKGVVGDVYTGLATAANAGALGIPEALAGREGRYAFDKAQEAHPKSALVGEVFGSIAPSTALIKGGGKVAGKLGLQGTGQDIAGEVAGNAIYGGIRGATGAESENRMEEAAKGAGLGAGASLVARLGIQGAKGFMDSRKAGAFQALEGGDFAIPPARGALPADEITPPAFQGMTDDQLRAESARAQRGLDAWKASEAKSAENAAARQAIQQEAAQTARANVNRQEAYVRENFRSTNPGSIDQIRADAAAMFPTTADEVLALPEFTKRLEGLKDFSTRGLEPAEILAQRQQRIDNYLLEDATPRSGKIPGVDLTTAQRAGLGEGEETLSALPVVHGARVKAVESFNRNNSARVLSRIGQELPKDIPVGTAMNAYVNKQLNAAYNTLRPAIKGKVDNGFNNGIAALRAQGTQTPERAALWQELESVLKRFRREDGTFDGEGYKDFSTTLRRYSEEWGQSGTPSSTVAKQDMARIAEQMRKQGQALVGRANPAAGRKLKNLEGAWAHQSRIEAASRGANRTERGVYAPDDYLASIERLDTSKNKGAAARGQAFDQPYAQDAREVMGGKPGKKVSIQTSGLTAFALSSLGLPGAVLAGGAGLSYIPGVKRIIQAVIDGRLGKTPKAVEEALSQSAAGRTLLKGTNATARQRIIEQLLRAETTQALED